jgi:two-component system, chemotaxis family, protein-glutamate methylesterase/glutaminase
MSEDKNIRIFIVDDSALVRRALTDIFSTEPGFSVIGYAEDPTVALRKFEQGWPDVIFLDIEMPKMDGITFLGKIMRERPTPVIICSSLAGTSQQLTMRAFAEGAVEVLAKPELGIFDFFNSQRREFIEAARSAGQAKLSRVTENLPDLPARPVAGKKKPAQKSSQGKVIAIGASTGGPQAIEFLLRSLDADTTPIIITQHMPEIFTRAFARRLDELMPMEVKEAEHGDILYNGRVLIAPGGKHMRLKRGGLDLAVELFDGPPVNRHRPSVDVLFRSVAETAPKAALGILLTGMGSDGARGLLEIRQAGYATIAQDEASSVVWGMPREAVKLGAVEEQGILSLMKIGAAIRNFAAHTEA